MQTEPRLSDTDEPEGREFLELLQDAPFSAPYAGRVHTAQT
jgi:hypothetical protein